MIYLKTVLFLKQELISVRSVQRFLRPLRPLSGASFQQIITKYKYETGRLVGSTVSVVCVGGCTAGDGCVPHFGDASFTADSRSMFEPWPRVVASPGDAPPRFALARLKSRNAMSDSVSRNVMPY